MLVAGTATPRPETWLELPRLELPRRVDGRGMPPVEVLDMRATDPRGGPLHPATLEALGEVRAAGAKAIVMINRRGFAPWLTCRSCGRHWDCPNCDVSLIVHRHSGRLVCHHCAHSEPLPAVCGECGSTTLSRAGAGTEQVEALLAERLAPMPVFRLDSDTAAAKGAHAEILARFGEAESGVLVGTQMVAKGHDFPEVTLSAILDADATLRFPDFRAGERTFAMVAQLAGRSGRGAAGGHVLVQTLAPGAASIAHAAEHDSAGFLAGEIERRRALRYPPFSHLVRVVLRAEDEARLEQASAKLATALAEELPEDADLLGPAPMFRVRRRHRRRLLVKADDRAATIAAVRAAVDGLAADRAVSRDVARSPSTSTRSSIGAGLSEERTEDRRLRTDGGERSEREIELIERREAALAQVVKFGDPVLKSRASPVSKIGEEPARRGRPDDRDHARRARGRPGRDPARDPPPPARLPAQPRRPADGADQPRGRVGLGRAGDRRGGLPQPAAGLDGRRAPPARDASRASTSTPSR